MDVETKYRLTLIFGPHQWANLIVAAMGLIIMGITMQFAATTQLDHIEVLLCIFLGALFAIVGLFAWTDRYDNCKFRDEVLEKLEELKTCLPPQNN
jgi:nicotinamide riboside transporter PnuC